MLERTLPENLDHRAHKASRRVGEIRSALEFARNANAILHAKLNRVCAPDPSTVMTLQTCVRLLQQELADAMRLEKAAIDLADPSA